LHHGLLKNQSSV